MSVFCNIRSVRHSARHPFSFDKYILVDIDLIVKPLLVVLLSLQSQILPVYDLIVNQVMPTVVLTLPLGMTGTLAVHPFAFDKYIVSDGDLIVNRFCFNKTLDR